MRHFTLIIFTVFCTSLFSQTMTVNRLGNNNKPFWLAKNVLVDPGFIIYAPINPSTGIPITQPASNQVGFFNVTSNTGVNAFPIDSGIVMCANWVEDVLPSQSGTNPGTKTNPKDPDLALVMGQIGSSNYDINDMAEIQFSFIATSDSIEFNYVFGSHEYQGYTCSQFNDVFGFFLIGQGVNGSSLTGNAVTVNLATIPGTTVPVAINTINQGFPSGSYPASKCLAANPNYVAHSVYYAGNNPIVSLSGNTHKFTAKAQVTCGFPYTIKLKLANASDHALSSAVFLEANSFKSPSINVNTTLNSGNSFQDSQIVEGCKPAYVVFNKDGNINKDMTIFFNYYGNAIPNVDYIKLPDSLFIPAGKAADTLEVYAFDDGITETNDSILIHMNAVTTSCFQYPPQDFTLYIRDKNPVVAQSNLASSSKDSIYCPGDTARIFGATSGGEGNLVGWWLDDSIAPASRVVQPLQTTTYYYYSTDECAADTAVDSITIYLVNYTPMTLRGDTTKICRGDTVTVSAEYYDGKAPYTVQWDNAIFGDNLTVIPTQDSTWYVFEVYDACNQSAKDSCLVWIAPDPYAGFSYMNDPGVPLKVNFQNNSVNAATYYWDYGDGTNSTDTVSDHTYTTPDEYMVSLTIVSADGCVDIYTTIVKVETDFYLYVPTAFTPDGDGLNEFFDIKGTGFETFQIIIFNRWGNQVFVSDDIDHSWDGTHKGKAVPEGVYTYTIFIQMPLGDISEKKGMLTLYR